MVGATTRPWPRTTRESMRCGADVTWATRADLGKAVVACVVVSTGGEPGVGARLEGVPLTDFKRSGDGKSRVIAPSAETLEPGVGVDLDRLPRLPSAPGNSAGARQVGPRHVGAKVG